MVAEAVALKDNPNIYSMPLAGKLYAAQAGELEVQIKNAVSNGAQHLILDCGSLEQIDSSALSAIISGLKYLYVRTKGKIVFLNINQHIERVLQLTQMTDYFPIAKDSDDALALISEAK